MERKKPGQGRGLAASVVAGVLLFVPVVTGAADEASNVRLVHVVEKATVARALDGAARKLAAPECQALLDEFADSLGRPLRATLQASGLSAPEYLGRIFFYDAPPRLCAHSALVSTRPESRVVFVCGSRFVQQMGRDPRHCEATLIHEALHSLGLGENPPSPDYISERVRARCDQR
jgi:hypothetical protein